jgi:predicted DNA-binding protein (UPF0251 family)
VERAVPRPRKRRRLWHEPQPAIFKPVGVPLQRLEQVVLLHEELEALRLADLEGRYQAESAEQLGVSRSTFQRILVAARRKVVQALVDGAALHIEGGTFRVAMICWQCGECGHRWEIEHGRGRGQPARCPACGSTTIRRHRRRPRR